MAWWITVYCRKPIGEISAEQLKAGITGGDPSAHAGVDRHASEALRPRLEQTKEIYLLQLGYSMLEDMGIVLAYEIARWLAQKGDGLLVDDDRNWQVIDRGAFRPVSS